MCGCFLSWRGCTVSLLMLQQKKQLNDLSGECFEGDFHLCSNSSRCTMFLSTAMKIVVGRKETMGTTDGVLPRTPVFLRRQRQLHKGLGCTKFSYEYIIALQMGFFSVCAIFK